MVSINTITILIFLALILVFSQLHLPDEEKKLVEIFIEEDIFFDPYCVTEYQTLSEFSSFDVKDEICNVNDSGSIRLGSSENVAMGSDTYTRYMFLKLSLSEIPKSDFWVDVKIMDSQLNINTLYDGNNTDPRGDFLIFNGLCTDSNWTERSKSLELPCLTEYFRPQTIQNSYSEPIYAKFISDFTIDVSSQIKYVFKNNLDPVTEIIEFVPMQHLVDVPFTKEQRECMFNSEIETLKAITDCFINNSIHVYSSEKKITSFNPVLNVNYEITHTSNLQAINTAIVAFIPIISSVIIYWDRQNQLRKDKMIRVCNTLEQEIDDVNNGLTGNDFIHRDSQKIDDIDGLPLIDIRFNNLVSFTILSEDAYNQVIYSGSLENFSPENQTVISTLYNHIKEYNKSFENLRKMEDKLFLNSGDRKKLAQSLPRYENLIHYYYTELGNFREIILSMIDDVKNILELERRENE